MLRNIEAVVGLSKMTRSALGPHGKYFILHFTKNQIQLLPNFFQKVWGTKMPANLTNL
jgi:hypothetical protein